MKCLHQFGGHTKTGKIREVPVGKVEGGEVDAVRGQVARPGQARPGQVAGLPGHSYCRLATLATVDHNCR